MLAHCFLLITVPSHVGPLHLLVLHRLSLCSTTSVRCASSFSTVHHRARPCWLTVHAHVRIKTSTLLPDLIPPALANLKNGGTCEMAEVTWSTCQLHTSTCWLHQTDTSKTHDRSIDTPYSSTWMTHKLYVANLFPPGLETRTAKRSRWVPLNWELQSNKVEETRAFI